MAVKQVVEREINRSATSLESLDDNFGYFLDVLLLKTLKGKTMTNPCSDSANPSQKVTINRLLKQT